MTVPRRHDPGDETGTYSQSCNAESKVQEIGLQLIQIVGLHVFFRTINLELGQQHGSKCTL